MKMPQLLRGILCVIETFHEYAREDGKGATLTCTELKRLLQSEFGDVLQPNVIHAVDRILNPMDIDRDGTISFDEFVLAIFNLLNLCYSDIQSLLNSEQTRVSKAENENPDNAELQAASGNGLQTERTSSSQDKLVLPSGMTSSAQGSPEERGPVAQNREDPQGDPTTGNSPGEVSGHNDPKIQYLEGDEQTQEVTQQAQALGDNEVQLETNKMITGSEQTRILTKGERPDMEIPREGDKLPAREQSDTSTRGQFGEQENWGAQSSLPGETVQRPSEGQEVAAEKDIKEHSKIQEPSLQAEYEPSSEHAGRPEQAAARKPSQTQKSIDPGSEEGISETHEPGKDANRMPCATNNSAEPEDDGRTCETQEPQTQEKEHETKGMPGQSNSRNVSDSHDVRDKKKEERNPEVHGTIRQKESERKSQTPALEAQTQDGKYQEFQGPSMEKNAAEGSGTQNISSEGGDQNHPEIEGSAAPEEARHTEESTAHAPVSSKNVSAVEGTPRVREKTQASAPLKSQSEGEHRGITKIQDKPLKKDDDCQEEPEPAIHNHEASYEIPNSLAPEDGVSSSEIGDLPARGNSQSQEDPHGGPVQGGYNNNPGTQKQVVRGEENTAQEGVVLAFRRQGEQLTEEQKQPAGRKHKSQGSGTRGPSPAVESSGHPDTQESIEGGPSIKSLESEIPRPLDADVNDQLSVTQQLAKGDSRKELKFQGPASKEEEDRATETHESQFKTLDENNSAPHEAHLATQEPATLQEGEERPQELPGECNDQYNPAKKGCDSAVPQAGLEEGAVRDPEPCPVERHEKIPLQTDMIQKEHQKQVQTAWAPGPELNKYLSRASPTSEVLHYPAFFNHSQTIQQCPRGGLPDTDPAEPQQLSAPQASEDRQVHPQREDTEPQRERSTAKQ